MDDLTQCHVINMDNTDLDVGRTFKDTQVFVYFFSSTTVNLAHTQIIQKLSKLVEVARTHGYGLEIIYVPLDQDSEGAMTFLQQEERWYGLRHGDPMIEQLKYMFNVTSIPAAVAVRRDGTVVTRKALGEVERYGTNVLEIWLEE